MREMLHPFRDHSIVVKHAPELPSQLLERAMRLGAATLHEAAGRIGSLPHAIKPSASSFRLAGVAFTVHSPANDNLWLHRALAVARPGDVLVVYTSGHYESGYWGEIMSTAGKEARLGGLVIDGCVRDGALLEGIGFPVFSRGLSIRGTGKDFGATGWLNQPVLIGDVLVAPGDLVVGDVDGVVAIPRALVEDVLDAAEDRERSERDVLDRLNAGETTLRVFDLDR